MKMTYVQRLIEALETRLWKFIRIVHSANRDFPYHDFKEIENDDEEDTKTLHYIVGDGNVNKHGNQFKRFVSKRMIIWTREPDTIIKLNHLNNVDIQIPITIFDSGASLFQFTIELRTNIREIWVTLASQGVAWIYCEGVLPQEARNPE